MKWLPPPGPERRRQVILLVVLLCLLLAIVWFWRSPTGTPTSASNPTVRGTNARSGQSPVPDVVRLDALESATTLTATERNPFVFAERQLPSVPGSSFLTTPQPMPEFIPPPAVPQGPPPITLRLTGMTVTVAGGRTMVTLKDASTNALYQAYEGDIVDGRYRVVKVGIQSVVVSYLDGTGIRTLPLGG